MDVKLPFDYRACWSDEYKVDKDGRAYFNELYEKRMIMIHFKEHLYRPKRYQAQCKDIMFYAIERNRLQTLLDEYTIAKGVF